MDVLMDFEGRLLTSDEIKSMMETEKGRQLIKEYALSGKIAYAAQEALNYLFEIDKKATEMTFDEMQELCQVIYYSIKFAKWDKVEAYLREACKESKKIFDKQDYDKYMEC